MMESRLQTTFERTLEGYAQGFHVSHIATFGLETCSTEDDISLIFQKMSTFDQIPVQLNGKIVGVLERSERNVSGKVLDAMRALDDSILVSSEEPLNKLLPLLAEPPYYRLVIRGYRINGIITRSDIHKLPVRLYGFTLVTNLELLMKEIIQQILPNDADWMRLISEKRQAKVYEEKEKYENKRLDPPMIELTNFCDKFTVLNKHLKLPRCFNDDLYKIEHQLRNPLAHAVSFAANEEEFQNFLVLIQKTQYWIQELSLKLVEK